VTVTFDEQGESPTDFNVDISDCSDPDFAVTSGGGAKSSSADAEVTFTNQNTITTATACLDVSLYVNGISIAVASRRIEYSVTASQSGTEGTATVSVTQSSLQGVAANSQTTQTLEETGTHTLVFTPTIVGTGPIQYGESFDVEIDAITGYDIDVSAISVGTITDEKNGVGFVSAPAKKSITIKLPLSSFSDAKGGTEIVDLTINWRVTPIRRQLRGETDWRALGGETSNSIPLQQSGSVNALVGHDDRFIRGESNAHMVVEVIPLDGVDKIDGIDRIDGTAHSSAFVLKYYLPASAVLAATASAILI
jgi:hypothetical protein